DHRLRLRWALLQPSRLRHRGTGGFGAARGADRSQGAAADGRLALGSSPGDIRRLWRAGGIYWTHQERARAKSGDLAAAGDARLSWRERRDLLRRRARSLARHPLPAGAGLCLHRWRWTALRRPSLVTGKVLARLARRHRSESTRDR